MLMKCDLKLINWWPRYFQKRLEDIIYLTPNEYTNTILQMNRFRKSTTQRNPQHTHHRTNYPIHHQLHRPIRHLPSYIYYLTTSSALAPVDTPKYTPDTLSITFNTAGNTDPPTHEDINDATTNDSTTDGHVNALFDACIFIDTVHLSKDTDTPSQPDDVSKKTPPSASSSIILHHSFSV